MPVIDPYATHLPLLVACVAHTKGPVLELGCGLYSTPLLHALCLDRQLTSLESNVKWYERFVRFKTANHRIEVGLDLGSLPNQQWSVVLVDQQPPNARVLSIIKLRSRVELFVVHDSEHRRYDYEKVLKEFTYRVESRCGSPWTTVVSDKTKLDWLESVV